MKKTWEKPILESLDVINTYFDPSWCDWKPGDGQPPWAGVPGQGRPDCDLGS